MDATTISARSLTKNFPATLEILADVVLNPSFPAEEIERQRASRLASSCSSATTPAQVAAQVTAAALYGARHPYGYSEIGTEASVKAMTRDDMVAFWKQNFVPNNAALVVAGDISMAELRALAEKSFGAWQRGTPAQPALGAPTTTPARVVIVDKPGSPQTQVRVASIGARALVAGLPAAAGDEHRARRAVLEPHQHEPARGARLHLRRVLAVHVPPRAGPFQVASGVRTDVTGPGGDAKFSRKSAAWSSGRCRRRS